MRKCTNCVWEGDEKLNVLNHCFVCGDETIPVAEIIEPKPEPEPKKKESLDYDLNKDGKVDKKDRRLAARLLGSKKGKK